MRTIELVPEEKKEEMRGYLNSYLTELSQYDNSITFDDNGNPIYKWFEFYWNDKGRYPFYLLIDGVIAGITFIREVMPENYEIAEFYVIPDFRRQGNGLWFAEEIANKFIGQMEFSTKLSNISAVKFWDKFSNGFDGVSANNDNEWRNWVIRKNIPTTHTCKLKTPFFELVESGIKTLEGRLNDEKRQLIKIGDYIEFIHESKPEKMARVIVTDKYLFDNFDQMSLFIDKESLGFDKNDSDEEVISVYRNIYSKEAEEKYGVVILKIELIK